ncbi:MAG: LuxR C-terminal-related transcriptional regulator [Polyangiales bacterium]
MERTRTISMSALLGALSLATDAANGVRPQTALRTAVLAVELAQRASLDGECVRAAFWTALLRFVGCTSFAHETALLSAGDDRAMLAALQTVDAASVLSVLGRSFEATQGSSPFARFVSLGRLVSSPSAGRDLASAHCAQAESLAALLEVDSGVRAALADLYERWDGLGNPKQKRAIEVHLAARVVHVAATAEAHDARFGADAAIDAVRAMSGRALDPSLCAVFERCGRELLASVERRAFERAIEIEPEPRWTIDAAHERVVFAAFARYADLKSPFTLGHSTSVCALVERVSVAIGLDVAAVNLARNAALVHDLGRVAVSNGVWDSVEPLGYVEMEQVRSHAQHTERVLSASEATRPLCAIASGAHERVDESGYPHARAPRTREAMILAACDVATALGEARPHRAAKSPTERVALLRAEVAARRLDAAVVDAVIAVTSGAPMLAPKCSELSEREVEVLALLARGASNKEIATALKISPKTVQHHVAHVYEKTGVRSRAAAALYAVERGWVVSSAASSAIR